MTTDPQSRRYAVHSVFDTVQGEGSHAGSPAVFVRFAGCNVWSGKESRREADAARGHCARWCDTDFVGTSGPGGGSYTADELLDRVRVEAGGAMNGRLVVLTGGEPTLQADDYLCSMLSTLAPVHMETNGSGERVPAGVQWVVLSPKPPMPVRTPWASELKVVVPAFDPIAVWHDVLRAGVAMRTARRWLQPCDDGAGWGANLAGAVAFARTHQGWSIGVQWHKVWRMA